MITTARCGLLVCCAGLALASISWSSSWSSSGLCGAAVALGAEVGARVHPVSISRASVYVTRESATARLEIFLEDLYLFHQLKPNRADFLERPTIEQGIELHKKFLSQRFELTDVDGQQFEPDEVVCLPAELPTEGVPLAELMGHQLTFELRYLFETPPDFITFTQKFTDEAAVLPSEVKLAVQQENAGAPVEQTLLPHIPFTMRVSWTNPPLSPEASQRERQAWAEREREELLGIVSFNAVYSFVYIEDFEVRHEVLAPLATLDEDLLIARDDDDVLDLSEQDAARPQIESYFATGNPLLVNGQSLEPVVQRCDFYGLDMKDFADPTQRKPVPLASARVGIVLSYRVPSPPQAVEMTWDRFNNSLWSVKSAVINSRRPGDASSTNLRRVGDRNRLQWQRPDGDVAPPELKPIAVESGNAAPAELPWLSVLLVLGMVFAGRRALHDRSVSGALVCLTLLVGVAAAWPAPRIALPSSWSRPAAVPDARAESIFRRVHANLYESFLRRTDESIYDSLAVSVAGSLLREIYLEVRRGLAMEDQGGAAARVREVEIIETRRLPNEADDSADALRLHCRWNVTGTIEHWGHIHRRTNQYVAEFSLAPVEGDWKIVGMKLLDEDRILSESTTL
ncbi:MAG: hypothetical protein KDB14_34795 [Planctomycetales bacterium]|nr:hypothetical protein [Planctomycetales bacterium]